MGAWGQSSVLGQLPILNRGLVVVCLRGSGRGAVFSGVVCAMGAANTAVWGRMPIVIVCWFVSLSCCDNFSLRLQFLPFDNRMGIQGL